MVSRFLFEEEGGVQHWNMQLPPTHIDPPKLESRAKKWADGCKLVRNIRINAYKEINEQGLS